MTAPEPSGCAITGDAAARTAAALLTADPPEIGAVREALHLAFTAGQPTVTVAAYDLSQVLASVDYLQERLAGTCEALAISDDKVQYFMAERDGRPPGGEG